jgi:ribonuclease VapC
LTLVVDSSAVMAVLMDEPEAETFFDLMDRAEPAIISAGNMIEIYRVVQAKARHRLADVDNLMAQLLLQVAPVDAAQVAFARDGMERFGKGRGTAPAVLDFGDLFAYALARARAAPLLFKGDDFTQTDLTPAWTP